MAPGLAGMDICTWKRRRGASVASTFNLTGVCACRGNQRRARRATAEIRMPSILATASRTSASDEVGHTGVLSHFEPRRRPFYLTFASVVSVLCSISASNCLIGAAVAALLVCHFRYGDALRFPPVKLPLGLFFLATLISVALSGHIREGWPGPRKFYLCLVLLLMAS